MNDAITPVASEIFIISLRAQSHTSTFLFIPPMSTSPKNTHHPHPRDRIVPYSTHLDTSWLIQLVLREKYLWISRISFISSFRSFFFLHTFEMARGKRPASSTPSVRTTNRRRTQPTDAGQASSSSTPIIENQTVGMDPELPEVIRSEPHFGKRRLSTQLALNLPPLHKLSDIYRSITARALELNLGEFLQHIGSKPLRIVTACSGTESPLLALELVQDSECSLILVFFNSGEAGLTDMFSIDLRKHFNRDFKFRHLFSAEIVPYKQRYIDNNFHPRLLFRDVTQLKDRVA